jgi:large subunit ribosomal protein L23
MAFDPYTILKYPLVTEKSSNLGPANKYVFAVAPAANKYQVKHAVETVYRVHVVKVGMINVPAKKKRYRLRIESYAPQCKKAIVTLKEGDRIAIT